jgi:DNA-binding transcriptional ArsR family regulator
MTDPPEGIQLNPQPLAELDRVVHEPGRLAIVALLSVLQSADFLFVMRQTGLTQGNLSSHLSKLEEAGYVQIEKHFEGKRPLTTLCLTSAGRRAFDDYRRTMQAMLKSIPD